jgi:hypothetical protein
MEQPAAEARVDTNPLAINLPNALTLLRIFLVPFLVVVLLTKFDGRETVGLLIFLTAVATDFLDGWIARRRGEITTLGTLLDPIADKLLISAAFISLVELGLAPAWMVGRRDRARVRGVGPAIDRVGPGHRDPGVELGQGEDVHADRRRVVPDPGAAPSVVRGSRPRRALARRRASR